MILRSVDLGFTEGDTDEVCDVLDTFQPRFEERQLQVRERNVQFESLNTLDQLFRGDFGSQTRKRVQTFDDVLQALLAAFALAEAQHVRFHDFEELLGVGGEKRLGEDGPHEVDDFDEHHHFLAWDFDIRVLHPLHDGREPSKSPERVDVPEEERRGAVRVGDLDKAVGWARVFGLEKLVSVSRWDLQLVVDAIEV